MKKQLFLPLALLLSFVSVKASDTVVTEPAPVDATAAAVTTPADQTAPAATDASAAPAAAPADVAPTVTPAPAVAPVAPAAQPAQTIPTEDDINRVLALVGAYQKQSDVIKSLHDLASTDDSQTTNLPTEDSVRSLLNLLELHKREADLIVSLRSSIASLQTAFSSLQATLGKWDNDVAALLTKKHAAKQKPARRGVDYEKVKDLVKKEARAQ